MQEKTKAIVISIILILLGLSFYLVDKKSYSFNFYQSELSINGSQIQETLSYQPDQLYHTLYRNFQSKVQNQQTPFSDTITMKEVVCSEGTPYFYTDYLNCYVNNTLETCLAYTKPNEYGCSFSYDYGFYPKNQYQIEASYVIQPINIIKIKENYYLKFIAYGRNNHPKLTVGKNLIITGEVITTKSYAPDEEVIIYIPHKGDINGFKIISQEGFYFDNRKLIHFVQILLSLIPGIAFFLVWVKFGREKTEGNFPEELSMYPLERKAWEVSTFFSSPFGSTSPKLISTLITDLYQRKIIDTKVEKKEVYIKLNKNSLKVDKVEEKFLELLKYLEEYSETKNGYFKLDVTPLSLADKVKLNKKYSSLSKEVSKEKDKYFESSAKPLLILLAVGLINAFLNLACNAVWIAVLNLFFIFFVAIIINYSTLLNKYKGNYYQEYQKWYSFKKFLSNSESIKKYGHKGTIILGKFLVYATALGVAKKVLEELKEKGIITEKQYNHYTFIALPGHFSSSTGGFGSISGARSSGAGGGGVGGGGGGGR